MKIYAQSGNTMMVELNGNMTRKATMGWTNPKTAQVYDNTCQWSLFENDRENNTHVEFHGLASGSSARNFCNLDQGDYVKVIATVEKVVKNDRIYFNVKQTHSVELIGKKGSFAKSNGGMNLKSENGFQNVSRDEIPFAV